MLPAYLATFFTRPIRTGRIFLAIRATFSTRPNAGRYLADSVLATSQDVDGALVVVALRRSIGGAVPISATGLHFLSPIFSGHSCFAVGTWTYYLDEASLYVPYFSWSVIGAFIVHP